MIPTATIVPLPTGEVLLDLAGVSTGPPFETEDAAASYAEAHGYLCERAHLPLVEPAPTP